MRTNVVHPVWVPPPDVRPAAGLIPVASLVIVVSAVLVLSCKQTDRQTRMITILM